MKANQPKEKRMKVRIKNRGFYNVAGSKKVVGLAEGTVLKVVRRIKKDCICDAEGQDNFFGEKIHGNVIVEMENLEVVND